ncbi:hypothetical protein [Brachybacterium fresconis]|uniref:Pyruvate/2-oxoglutarate dehydrogenase complex dihydrolipoamide acyltransferase (E2) component n=1 Tax=Brachybacterium fresconis TaxID=173363 RepID=A0ABS4YFC6_9MICO|nr:hypothetical protein [Brachybacterium fresconis]MBP2407499.1 pyruvate/2-oxoglutarate dehydrogenase complex dihydrolipoamide acyltransferase (E2) component [Brachybacterium fresconis]
MDLDRGPQEGTADRPPSDPEAPAQPRATIPVLGSADTTALLRRCTALAARARVDLLSAGRRSAAEELEEVLDVLGSWDGSEIVDPDPTMVVLAAAALQDLLERLPASARPALGDRAEVALRVLHALMVSGRIDAMA